MKNDPWIRAKARYDETELPEELAFSVASALRKGERERQHRRSIRRVLTGAVACCACFLVVVNASPGFARAVEDVPLLGGLARIFTVTNYTINDREHLIDVRLPALENTGHTTLERRVNAEIQTRIDALLTQAEDRARQTREAYLATGGQVEDFIPVIIDVDYTIQCRNDRYLSFLLTTTETQATAYAQTYTYNLDLELGREITLSDILGADYVEIANATVRAGIAARSEDAGNSFWGEGDAGAFQSIRPDQPFYLNQAGNPVILFEKYEIAPGFMGEQTFEVADWQ